jgi:hypothetical protein
MNGIIIAGTTDVETSIFGINIDIITPYDTPYQNAKIWINTTFIKIN